MIYVGITLPPGHVASASLELHSPKRGTQAESMVIASSISNLPVDLQYTGLRGKVEFLPSSLYFVPTFPRQTSDAGKARWLLPKETLQLFARTGDSTLQILDVRSKDPRFSVQIPADLNVSTLLKI